VRAVALWSPSQISDPHYSVQCLKTVTRNLFWSAASSPNANGEEYSQPSDTFHS